MVPGGAMGGALGGMVRQNWTFHLSSAAWSGNCRERDEKNIYDYIYVVLVLHCHVSLLLVKLVKNCVSS